MANKPSHMIFAGSSGSTVKKFRTGKWMDTINACPNLQALITDKSDKNAVNDLHTQQNGCHERCNSDPHPTPEIRSRG